jgi:hypothetical protein
MVYRVSLYGLYSPTSAAKGRVALSHCVSRSIASDELLPHISLLGCRLPQTAGRSALLKSRQRLSSLSCTQRVPAGLPCSMEGMDEEIDGAIQHAAQFVRHSIRVSMTIYSSFESEIAKS